MQTLRHPLRRQEKETFWALKDINFDIKKGDVVGIIGRNGAGKSTLLKVLSRITEPTTGEIRLYGRVGSLLEVGTGFHPELTGRENIYLNGAILGMRRREIDRHFDEIVDFAGVEKFLDTPVKRYSSGMYVRLAFAVAAHLNPEILIVDEVLSVGDAEFQKKCLGKMGEVAKAGRTVLLVSHNMAAVRQLCKYSILIVNGSIEAYDNSFDVVNTYFNTHINNTNGKLVWNDIDIAPESDVLKLISIEIKDLNGNISNQRPIDEQTLIELKYLYYEDVNNARIVIEIISFDGTIIFQTGPEDIHVNDFIIKKGIYKSTCLIPANFLNTGDYYLNVVAHIPNKRFILNGNIRMKFNILQSIDIGGYGKRPGWIRPILNWNVKQIQE